MRLFKVDKQPIPKTLAERFLVPPFSVFNTHAPYWKQRMLMWRDMGLCSTNGRVTSNNGLAYDNRRMDKRTRKYTIGTSTFSPVLAEIVYKWFTVPGSNQIFDPFGGGITRGGIAACLGHKYLGYDINPLQVESNYVEKENLFKRFDVKGTCEWVCDDCLNFDKKDFADLIFTCPPYFNLERYTDLAEDLSNTDSYDDFLQKYDTVLEFCYSVLKQDSFMVWVVSDVRDKRTTEYYGLVADTIKLGQKAGFKLYNEIILYNETNNLAITSGDYINRVRKVGRQHQNILVFYKGDTKQIKSKYGEIYTK